MAGAVEREPGDHGDLQMTLKAPGILTFMLSVILVVVVMVVKFFGAEIPLLVGREFYALLAAHALLVTGCLMRGL
jgi:hypothetical protein